MSTKTATEQQKRWNEIVRDPLLSQLPYKVETNARGQILLSPQTNQHSIQQKSVESKLDELLPEGEAFQEWAIATSGGTKQADVIWASDDRLSEMRETGDPSTLAPEICVEVMSDSNDWEEMRQKRQLYLGAGAREVWVVEQEGRVHFFEEQEIERSEIAPEFPPQV
jgi:Uma2 family endonuclease